MKIKLKELFRKKEDDLDLDLNEELNDPDIRIETYEMTEDPQAKEELWDKIKKHQKFVHNRNAITMGLLFILLFGLGTFLFFHTGSTYLTSDRIGRLSGRGFGAGKAGRLYGSGPSDSAPAVFQ